MSQLTEVTTSSEKPPRPRPDAAPELDQTSRSPIDEEAPAQTTPETTVMPPTSAMARDSDASTALRNRHGETDSLRHTRRTVGKPGEIARLVSVLASDKATYLTGSTS